jgi:hypothetical protein
MNTETRFLFLQRRFLLQWLSFRFWLLIENCRAYYFRSKFMGQHMKPFLLLKGPVADATDAPQPWRLIVASCDEDEDDYFFFIFPCNEIDRGKPKYSGKKPVPVPLCQPQIPHGPTWDRTRAFAVRGRRLTAWAMAICCSATHEISSLLRNRKVSYRLHT